MPDAPSPKRLLLEINNAIREINQQVINPEIPELNLQGLKPAMTLVAKARARYLKALFEITETNGDTPPSKEQIEQLKELRYTYEELLHVTQALENAISRGYLDVSFS